ncbi:MAG: hypothetical protein U0401_11135 [Anaerolineae bacterium]
MEYHAYEALVIGDIVRLTYAASASATPFVIGCFYDVGLREAARYRGRPSSPRRASRR